MVNPISYRSSRSLFGIIILIIYVMLPLNIHNTSDFELGSMSSISSSLILQEDTMAPTIHNWSYSEIVADEYFIIWANVSDDDSGILNVTAIADVTSGEANDSVFLLEFNGSLFITDEAILNFNNTYRLWVESYDNEMNHRISYGRTIDLHPTDPTDITKDPNLTMPYVIGSTLALLALIVLISFYYSKTKREST